MAHNCLGKIVLIVLYYIRNKSSMKSKEIHVPKMFTVRLCEIRLNSKVGIKSC